MPVLTLPPCPVAFDRAGGFIYGHDPTYQLVAFTPQGVAQQRYEFASGPGDDTQRFLVHPDGRKVLVATRSYVSWLELP
jgi:hypothetical protein